MSLNNLPLEESVSSPFLSSPSIETLAPIIKHLIEKSSNPNDICADQILEIYDLQRLKISKELVQSLIEKFSEEN